MKRAIVSGPLDDLRFADVRFLQEASNLGPLHLLLWPDAAVQRATGKPPKFPFAERDYVVSSLRFVQRAIEGPSVVQPDSLPNPVEGDTWVMRESEATDARRRWCEARGIELGVIADATLAIAPPAPECPVEPRSSRKKVVVTGCFDWFHSGHVRFFEEVSELGHLYVVVGHDDNIRLLKGEGHPLFPAVQRRYIAGAIRFVTQALISTGDGWMDAEPEFLKIRPDIYAVNEDGDRPEKREFCDRHGIEYRVLKRLPREGLPRRQSTSLRGF